MRSFAPNVLRLFRGERGLCRPRRRLLIVAGVHWSERSPRPFGYWPSDVERLPRTGFLPALAWDGLFPHRSWHRLDCLAPLSCPGCYFRARWREADWLGLNVSARAVWHFPASVRPWGTSPAWWAYLREWRQEVRMQFGTGHWRERLTGDTVTVYGGGRR